MSNKKKKKRKETKPRINESMVTGYVDTAGETKKKNHAFVMIEEHDKINK